MKWLKRVFARCFHGTLVEQAMDQEVQLLIWEMFVPGNYSENQLKKAKFVIGDSETYDGETYHFGKSISSEQALQAIESGYNVTVIF